MRPDETLERVAGRLRGGRPRDRRGHGRARRPRPAGPCPPRRPLVPRDVDAWSVRWVLLHLIEETARHAGHADIIREHLDGATAFELMAAAEGWPATDWLKPWQLARRRRRGCGRRGRCGHLACRVAGGARRGVAVNGARRGPSPPRVPSARPSSGAWAPTPTRGGTARWPSLRGSLPRWRSRWCGPRSTPSSATAPVSCSRPSPTPAGGGVSRPWSRRTSRPTPAGAGCSSGAGPPGVASPASWSWTRSTSSCGARPVRRDRKAAAALAPYVAWSLFATALNADIWRRNR